MIETRGLSLKEVETLDIFPIDYRSRRSLELDVSGTEPELVWRFRITDSRRPVVRTLEGGTVDSLIELYGPPEGLRFIGAFDEDRLVGLLTWKVEEWNECAWLCDIRVHESCRRTGVGSLLLTELQWLAIRKGTRGIMLETQNTNVVAIAFYLSRGFKMVGMNSAMYGRPGTANADVALFFYLSLGD